ncbi:MAG: DUF1080 domain-containing protein [Deltaproteobacteria bacterium]
MTKSRLTVLVLAMILCAAGTIGVSSADDKDGWISLFNGKDLTGWKASEGVEWKVEKGEIVTPPKRSHLFTEQEFKNFEYKVDCLTTPGSNSGLYVHTKYQDSFPDAGYEVQVNQTHGDPVKSGSLYNVVKLFSSPVKDNEWYTYHITVKGKQITVRINDKVLYEYVEPEGVTGPRKLSKGSFAIQAHDPKSVARYKNIMVKPLPD